MDPGAPGRTAGTPPHPTPVVTLRDQIRDRPQPGHAQSTCSSPWHWLLDRTLIWNQAHLLHALREYECHHNRHRPHRGIANARPLLPLPEPITDPDELTRPNIDRHDRLGGLLHEYRNAA